MSPLSYGLGLVELVEPKRHGPSLADHIGWSPFAFRARSCKVLWAIFERHRRQAKRHPSSDVLLGTVEGSIWYHTYTLGISRLLINQPIVFNSKAIYASLFGVCSSELLSRFWKPGQTMYETCYRACARKRKYGDWRVRCARCDHGLGYGTST